MRILGRRTDGVYLVENDSQDAIYEVDFDLEPEMGALHNCSCPHSRYRERFDCKHVQFINQAIAAGFQIMEVEGDIATEVSDD